MLTVFECYLIGLCGMWLLCDALISLALYLPTSQTWSKDHWVRIVRLVCGVFLMFLVGKGFL